VLACWPASAPGGFEPLPDGLVSRCSQPCLGLRSGYATHAEALPELLSLSTLERSHWHDDLPILRESFPDWTFEDDWAE
jgi:hypothetical protein